MVRTSRRCVVWFVAGAIGVSAFGQVPPAEATEPPRQLESQDRARLVLIGGAATAVVGGGMLLLSNRFAALAAGNPARISDAQHLGVAGGALALFGLCAVAASAVMFSWGPTTVAFTITPPVVDGRWSVAFVARGF